MRRLRIVERFAIGFDQLPEWIRAAPSTGC
jgi:hypothetical protein